MQAAPPGLRHPTNPGETCLGDPRAPSTEAAQHKPPRGRHDRTAGASPASVCAGALTPPAIRSLYRNSMVGLLKVSFSQRRWFTGGLPSRFRNRS